MRKKYLFLSLILFIVSLNAEVHPLVRGATLLNLPVSTGSDLQMSAGCIYDPIANLFGPAFQMTCPVENRYYFSVSFAPAALSSPEGILLNKQYSLGYLSDSHYRAGITVNSVSHSDFSSFSIALDGARTWYRGDFSGTAGVRLQSVQTEQSAGEILTALSERYYAVAPYVHLKWQQLTLHIQTDLKTMNAGVSWIFQTGEE